MRKFTKKPILLFRSELELERHKALLNGCNEQGWRMINMNHSDNYVPEGEPIVGAILSGPTTSSTVEMLRERNIFIVSIAGPTHKTDNDAVVLQDRLAAGRCAADAFAERGFGDVGHIEFEGYTDFDPLIESFRERAETKHGAKVHVCRLPQVDDYQSQVPNLAKWLKTMPMPLGIFAYNFWMGIRVTIACEHAGLAVPEQVAIICRGNDESKCIGAPIPLSAIDMNPEEQIKRAIQIVKENAEGITPPATPVYTPIKGFVERRSTDILAIPDIRVAKAIRFMWDNLRCPLSVDEVAREVGVSRNTLERAFKASLGRGVNAELRRKRLERCKELLRSAQLPLDDIVKAVGWSSRSYLHSAFKKAFDMTPEAYRESYKGDLRE